MGHTIAGHAVHDALDLCAGTKVGELALARGIDKHVLPLDVAMHNAFLVQMLQTVKHLPRVPKTI